MADTSINAVRRQSKDSTSHKSHSLGDHITQVQKPAKQQRHVVGHAHGRLGARTYSSGRNLSKLATTVKDNAAPQDAHSVSLQRASMKRSTTALASIPRSSSHTVLRKNHSSGHLTRVAHTKTSAKRPEYNRAQSHPHPHTLPPTDKDRSKRKSSPSRKQPAVRFDMGDDDDAEGMEGVDDVWTEGSASQSPSTTRDNTRSNTRSNSVILDPGQRPFRKSEGVPLATIEQTPIEVVIPAGEDQGKASQTRDSSYHENLNNLPNADAISKRLLQRSEHRSAEPQLSDISVIAKVGDDAALSTSGREPLISRFIDKDSAPGSKDGTPREQSHLAHVQQLERSSDGNIGGDVKRNQSTPSFMTPFTPATEGNAGTATPGGSFRPSRTQQKLWLQRGLSAVEANSQQSLPGLLTPGRTLRGGAVVHQYERIEKELAVVRRFRHPVEESMARLRLLNDSPLKDADVGNNSTPSPQRRTKARDGAKTPRGTKASPSSARSHVSFALPTPGTEPEQSPGEQPKKRWEDMTLDELEEATLEARRQMWDLQSVGEVED